MKTTASLRTKPVNLIYIFLFQVNYGTTTDVEKEYAFEVSLGSKRDG